MPHFALVTTDGDTLGTVELGRPDWPDGSVIYRGGEPNLRVVGRIAADDTEHPLEVLVVEETSPPVRSIGRNVELRAGIA